MAGLAVHHDIEPVRRRQGRDRGRSRSCRPACPGGYGSPAPCRPSGRPSRRRRSWRACRRCLPRPAGTPASPCRRAAAPGRVSTAATPSKVVVWMSWPQACIRPGLVLAKGRPLVSWIGSASMSARMASTGPGGRPRSARPRRFCPSRSGAGCRAGSVRGATMPAVRTSSKPSSGWAWMSRRISISSGSIRWVSLRTAVVGSLRRVWDMARPVSDAIACIMLARGAGRKTARRARHALPTRIAPPARGAEGWRFSFARTDRAGSGMAARRAAAREAGP